MISPRRLDLPGIDAHRILLADDEVTVELGIPVTTPARTLLDLATVVAPHHLERAFQEAEVRRLTSPTSLDVLVARYPGRRGTRAIKELLTRHQAIGRTVPTSILERRLLALLDAHGLPRPQINRLSREGELDATWPKHRLIVECDGFATHGTRKAFEEDRARDRELTAAGWRVVRITWRQLIDDPGTIARHLAARCEPARPSAGASGATTTGRRRGSRRPDRAGGGASRRRWPGSWRWGRRWSWVHPPLIGHGVTWGGPVSRLLPAVDRWWGSPHRGRAVGRSGWGALPYETGPPSRTHRSAVELRPCRCSS